MRVMVDTNVLVSALLFPSPNMNSLMYKLTTDYQLVISSFVVDELIEVTKRKFADKASVVDKLFSQLPYELVYTPVEPPEGLYNIRDIKDYPVLYTAIIEDVDVLVTGDDDFFDFEIEKPEIIKPADFLKKY